LITCLPSPAATAAVLALALPAMRAGSTWIEIDRPRMYSLLKRDRYVSRTLALLSRSTGLQLFAFTFVSCVPRP